MKFIIVNEDSVINIESITSIKKSPGITSDKSAVINTVDGKSEKVPGLKPKEILKAIAYLKDFDSFGNEMTYAEITPGKLQVFAMDDSVLSTKEL
ncbi:hypothetical protein ACXHQ0_15825 [Vibrio antiquarius]|uniref:Uncharacterized protein n=2 Tax=Vibrio TaxID=662 RepID=A0AA46UQ85_VIBPH|nr:MULTISPECIES: hypothetical protein [Vibrio]EGR3228616.1 hypothetical protein [Vibrio parahaemolyticus]EJG0181204.1 hypothetical protein [Vibrio parahaemolyticus]EPP21611.1 hypothetical protein L910_1290 [Vibrio fluvialis PG41]KOE80267.1 hypothetical protein ACS91_22985 [Vibrio parahaemolyticus]MCS0314569.1 hypothetical protein [Vibrio diabolicus]